MVSGVDYVIGNNSKIAKELINAPSHTRSEANAKILNTVERNFAERRPRCGAETVLRNGKSEDLAARPATNAVTEEVTRQG
jgi:hypothetical protein